MDLTATRQRASAWRRLVLPASLTLNLFLAALVVGHGIHSRLVAAEPNATLAAALANAKASLPPGDAAAFGAVMDRESGRYSASARSLAQAREAVEKVILAPSFDRDAASASFAEWRKRSNTFFEDFAAPLIDALAEVSPDGRRGLIAQRAWK